MSKPRFLWILIIICVSLVSLEIGLRFGGYLFLNSLEKRNEISLKQPGVCRIMCLGESMTALGSETSYPRLLEKILRKTGTKVSVINKGVPGITSVEILARLESNLDTYAPDIVLTMIGINDTAIFTITRHDVQSVVKALQQRKALPAVPFMKSIRVYELAKGIVFFLSKNVFSLKIAKNDATSYAYQEIRDTIIQRGMTLVCVQYPLCPLQPLKQIIGTHKRLLYVDNEILFQKRVVEKSYDTYFYDRFAGNFGHCTEEGRNLLAQNIAHVLEQEYFKISDTHRSQGRKSGSWNQKPVD